MSRQKAITLASVAALSLGACAETETTEEDTATMDEMSADQMALDDTASGTIVEVAQGNPDFSTLVAAVTAADLGETLSGGDYTVFAPTNDAFAAVGDDTLNALLQPENRDQLTAMYTLPARGEGKKKNAND